jgi:hypothetical protein
VNSKKMARKKVIHNFWAKGGVDRTCGALKAPQLGPAVLLTHRRSGKEKVIHNFWAKGDAGRTCGGFNPPHEIQLVR